MSQVSLVRLYVMRAAYLILAIGLALMIWPKLINPAGQPEHMQGVVRALLGAVGLLAVIGIRYPLQMLPLLFFELVWKTIWLLAIGLPSRAAGVVHAGVQETWGECLFGVIFCLVAIPWGYVWHNYVKRQGDAWTRGSMEAGERVA